MSKNFTVSLLKLLGVFLLTTTLAACADEMNGKKKPGDGEKADDYDSKVVYGEDNRLDIYQVQDAQHLRLADSTVALIESSNLRESGTNTEITLTKYADSFGAPLCEGERFREQDTAAFCSGFLVAPNVVVTAGHCIRTQGSPTSDCETTRFVFGFGLPAAGARPSSVKTSEVYKCQRIVKQYVSSTGADYAVIELDRNVAGHSPLKLRRSGAAVVNDELMVIGHPSGLPTKVAGGARVRALYSAYLQTNLDTYGGNSGSAVFNSRTFEVEGILVRGEEDFVRQGSCLVSKRCDMDKCRGEDVTKISEVLAFVPNVVTPPGSGGPSTPTDPTQPPVVEPPAPRKPAVYSNGTLLAIPDNNANGVASTVVADQAPNGRKVTVAVNISHTWRGDLYVTLVAPNGQQILLANRTGRSEDNIVGVYGTTLVADQSLASLAAVSQTGVWQLKISDRAARDTGKLNSWALKFE